MPQPSPLQRELFATLDRLFKSNREAMVVRDCEYEEGRQIVNIPTEILKLDTGDSGTEVVVERILDDVDVPADFDIDTILTLDELETLLSVMFYILQDGKVEVHVAYRGVSMDGGPLEMYSGQADERSLHAILTKLERAVALFPEGVEIASVVSPALPPTKSKKRKAANKKAKPRVMRIET